MSQPVFAFCIRRMFDGEEVWAEIADVQAVMLDTAYEAYLALPWYKRIAGPAVADAVAKAFSDGFDRAIDRLKNATVRL